MNAIAGRAMRGVKISLGRGSNRGSTGDGVRPGRGVVPPTRGIWESEVGDLSLCPPESYRIPVKTRKANGEGNDIGEWEKLSWGGWGGRIQSGYLLLGKK